MKTIKLITILSAVALPLFLGSNALAQVPAASAETVPPTPEKKSVTPEEAYNKWGNSFFFDLGFGLVGSNVNTLSNSLRAIDPNFTNFSEGMPTFSLGWRKYFKNRHLLQFNFNGATQRKNNADMHNRFSTFAFNIGYGYDLVKHPRWFVAPTLNVGIRQNAITRTFSAGTFDATLKGAETNAGGGAYLYNNNFNLDAGLTLSYLYKNVDEDEDMAGGITMRLGYQYSVPSSKWGNYGGARRTLDGPSFGFQGVYFEVLLPLVIRNN